MTAMKLATGITWAPNATGKPIRFVAIIHTGYFVDELYITGLYARFYLVEFSCKAPCELILVLIIIALCSRVGEGWGWARQLLLIQ